jgi:hypothetical protein
MALEGVKEQWANGAFQVFDGSDALNTTIANAGALAELRTYERLMDLSYEQFTLMLEEEDDQGNDRKPNGPGANGTRAAVRAV